MSKRSFFNFVRSSAENELREDERGIETQFGKISHLL